MTQPGPASPMFWRFKAEVYRLTGIHCKACGHISYPRSKICPECGSENLEQYTLPKRGTIHTFCVNWAPPPQFEPPILPVIVDLEGGGKYQGMLTECDSPDQIKIGTKVEMVFRKMLTDRGLNIYGYKFRLAEEG